MFKQQFCIYFHGKFILGSTVYGVGGLVTIKDVEVFVVCACLHKKNLWPDCFDVELVTAMFGRPVGISFG
jgi:hypothetical protein